MTKTSLNYLAPVAFFIFAFNANASSKNEFEETQWGVGGGVRIKQTPYEGFDNETKFLPILYVENNWIKLLGNRVDGKVYTSENLSLFARAKFDFGNVYEESDSYVFEGTDERDSGLWLGPNIEWKTSLATLSFQILTDVSNKSDGLETSLSLNRTFQLTDHLRLETEASLIWYDDSYIDYYYGVRPHEQRDNRDIYEGQSTLNYELSTHFRYSFNKHHSVVAGFKYEGLGNEIKDSPLVDGSSSSRIRLFYFYKF